jgi:hypothetical protein
MEEGERSLAAAIALADDTMRGGVAALAKGLFPLRHALAQVGEAGMRLRRSVPTPKPRPRFRSRKGLTHLRKRMPEFPLRHALAQVGVAWGV